VEGLRARFQHVFNVHLTVNPLRLFCAKYFGIIDFRNSGLVLLPPAFSPFTAADLDNSLNHKEQAEPSKIQAGELAR
jgi:hypothetical protein